MRYVIYFILLIVSFVVGHFKSGISLHEMESEPGQFGEYVGGVFLSPLILPTIIFFIVKIFRRHKETNYIRCSNWVLGIMLLSNISYALTFNTPRYKTLPEAQVTFTVPDRGWKIEEAKSNGRQVKMLFSGNYRIAIYAERHSQAELNIYNLKDIKAFSKKLLGDAYDEDLFQVYECTAKNFRCAFQMVSSELHKKEIIYVYLLDKESVIQLTVVINEDNFEKDYAVFKTILDSAVNANP